MLPEACKKAAQQSSLGYLFGGGERHILPSFFNLLIHLQKQVTSTPPLSSTSVQLQMLIADLNGSSQRDVQA